MSDRKEESRKYYHKNKERILEYQRKRRIEKKVELKAKRDKKKLAKQVYDFNQHFKQDMITVAEWKKILKSTPNCPGCGKPFLDILKYPKVDSVDRKIDNHPTLQYEPDEHRVIAVCQNCINPFIRGRMG